MIQKMLVGNGESCFDVLGTRVGGAGKSTSSGGNLVISCSATPKYGLFYAGNTGADAGRAYFVDLQTGDYAKVQYTATDGYVISSGTNISSGDSGAGFKVTVSGNTVTVYNTSSVARIMGGYIWG